MIKFLLGLFGGLIGGIVVLVLTNTSDSPAEWLSVIFSGVALIMVIWQTNATRKSEKELVIYEKNIEKFAIIRRTINDLEKITIESITDSNKDSLSEVYSVLDQLEIDLSFIDESYLNHLETDEKLTRFRTLLREVDKYNYYTKNYVIDDIKDFEPDKIFEFYENLLLLIQKIKKDINNSQKELLN